VEGVEEEVGSGGPLYPEGGKRQYRRRKQERKE